jgi:hypothetical protein
MFHWFFCLSLLFNLSFAHDDLYTDILVVGGGASGTAAGVQAARMGASVIIVEETTWLGGMLTSAGVSAVDGNYNLPAGLWGEFKEGLVKYYGSDTVLRSGWVSNVLFEPSAGDKVLKTIAGKEKNLSIFYESVLKDIHREKDVWRASVKTKEGMRTIHTKLVIDATELGDVAKSCGVKYDVGMDSRFVTRESIAPAKANSIIQDLTYVAILKDYGRDMTMPRPAGYDSSLFGCCCENNLCTNPKEPHRLWPADKMLTYGKLPNNKYMINWPIEGNDYYLNLVDLSPEQREKSLEAAKNHTMCFVYFLQKELGYKSLYLADDEFPTQDKLPFIPYHRESRRIRGLIRFDLNHITQPYDQPEKLYRTCIAVGDYPVDHHHARYYGWDSLPDLHFYPVPSYGLPLGVLIPKDVEGLIVAEKSISVTNLVNGTTRLQPVVLQIGQAAGALAAISVKKKIPVGNVEVRQVQDAVLDAKGYLLPYLDYPVDHPWFKSIQKIGSTGILKGVGKNAGWSNQTWFRADTLLLYKDLKGLTDVYPSAEDFTSENTVTVEAAIKLIEKIARGEKLPVSQKVKKEALEKAFHSASIDVKRNITRGEMAVLIDILLDPFHHKPVDIKGNFIKN